MLFSVTGGREHLFLPLTIDILVTTVISSFTSDTLLVATSGASSSWFDTPSIKSLSSYLDSTLFTKVIPRWKISGATLCFALRFCTHLSLNWGYKAPTLSAMRFRIAIITSISSWTRVHWMSLYPNRNRDSRESHNASEMTAPSISINCVRFRCFGCFGTLPVLRSATNDCQLGNSLFLTHRPLYSAHEVHKKSSLGWIIYHLVIVYWYTMYSLPNLSVLGL